MKYILSSTLLLVTLFLSSFTTEPAFNKDGITFSVPDEWKITEEQNLDGKGYYLSCEKTGDNSSGLVSITWVNDTISIVGTIDAYRTEIVKNFTEKKANPKLSATKTGTYNGNKCTMVTYTLTLLNVPHRGAIYCFHKCNKTVTILTQEATEDIEANKAGLKTIEQTLKCSDN